jgi:prepilin-type N-terminal cleavage/methylation domain-containing protein
VRAWTHVRRDAGGSSDSDVARDPGKRDSVVCQSDVRANYGVEGLSCSRHRVAPTSVRRGDRSSLFAQRGGAERTPTSQWRKAICSHDGFALLEVMIALALVAIVSIAALGYLSNIARFQRDAQQLEAEAEDADRLIKGFSLMTAAEANARVGLHVRGKYVITIRPVSNRLFELSVAIRVTPTVALARTRFFYQ